MWSQVTALHLIHQQGPRATALGAALHGDLLEVGGTTKRPLSDHPSKPTTSSASTATITSLQGSPHCSKTEGTIGSSSGLEIVPACANVIDSGVRPMARDPRWWWHLGRGACIAAAFSGCVTQISVNKDVEDTAEDRPGDTPDPDLPSDTPSDSPSDTPSSATPTSGAQGCAAPLSASDGMYATTGCLAPWSVSAAAAPASDGQLILQPGALRRIVP